MAVTDKPSLSASTSAIPERRSGAFHLFPDSVHQVAADDIAELLADAVGLLAIGGAVHLVDGEALVLEEFGGLVGLLDHGAAPVGRELMRCGPQRFLQIRRQ